MYSAFGDYKFKESFKPGIPGLGPIVISEEQKQAIQAESDRRGTSISGESVSVSTKTGGKTRTVEREEIVNIKTLSETENETVSVIDIESYTKSNTIIKKQSRKTKDTFSKRTKETNNTLFNVWDKEIETNKLPFLLPKTGNMNIGNYLAIYMTFTTGQSVKDEEMLVNFPAGYT